MAVDWEKLRDRFDEIIKEAVEMDENEVGMTLRGETRARVLGRENAMYEFIVRFKQANDGNSPTMREIGEALGMRSTSYIQWYLEKLEKRGLIRLNQDGAGRMICVNGGQWRLMGGGYGQD